MKSKLELIKARVLTREEQKLIVGAEKTEDDRAGTYYCTTTGARFTTLADCVANCKTECLVTPA
jgi:hypothetical protein